jgi:hypothetical protein
MKLIDILKESLINEVKINKLNQNDIDTLSEWGFDIWFNVGDSVWIERKPKNKSPRYKIVNQLLTSKNIPFKVDYIGSIKEIWVNKKYFEPGVTILTFDMKSQKDTTIKLK